MKIIIHIGQSKTGTTALQSVLNRSRDKLSEHGILYPDCFINGVPIHMLNHNAFANSLNDVSFYPHLTAEQYWKQFEEQFQSGKYHTLLLSGESFYGGRPHPWEDETPGAYYKHYEYKLKKLKSFIDTSDVEIICYLRSQNEWLESAIPHIIRYEGTMGQKVYKNDEQAIEMLTPFLDYNHVIGLWDSIIKPRKVKLCEYRRDNFPQQDIVRDFFDKIGLPNLNLQTSDNLDNTNDSWSREFIEVKKEINLTSHSRVKEDTTIRIIDKLNKDLIYQEKYQIKPHLHSLIIEKFREGNNELSLKHNNNEPIFSQKRLEKLCDRPYQELDEEKLAIARKSFYKFYNSMAGKKIFLFQMFKRYLRKGSPFLYSICAVQWRKWKQKKTRNLSNG